MKVQEALWPTVVSFFQPVFLRTLLGLQGPVLPSNVPASAPGSQPTPCLQSYGRRKAGLGRSAPGSQTTPSTVLAMGGERPRSFWPCQPNHTVYSPCYGWRKALVVLALSAKPHRLQSLLRATKGLGRSAPVSQPRPSTV